eukprot:CAMPEP_0172322064 /NCGR_PEP_ID=MMETSP1058-20130122/44959_1 /TAXON_ID=83371 /ORGANISM="Detonula confervacea, Strain CCMP 353" /LENGTH=49 /DNA_ID= /DNA_START= /DNA_END= /DNA_ORIENTATION=
MGPSTGRDGSTMEPKFCDGAGGLIGGMVSGASPFDGSDVLDLGGGISLS